MHRTDHKIKKSKQQQISERQNGLYGSMATSRPSDKAREIFNRPVYGTNKKGDKK